MSITDIPAEWGLRTNTGFPWDKAGNDVKQYILSTDIRAITGLMGFYDINKTEIARTGECQGPIFCQITNIKDVSKPSNKHVSMGERQGLLTVAVNTVKEKLILILAKPVPEISLNTPPGVKLLIKSTADQPLFLKEGRYFLVYPANVRIIGGTVESMEKAWRASREVGDLRKLNRTDAPRFLNFKAGQKVQLLATEKKESTPVVEERPMLADIPEAAKVEKQKLATDTFARKAPRDRKPRERRRREDAELSEYIASKGRSKFTICCC